MRTWNSAWFKHNQISKQVSPTNRTGPHHSISSVSDCYSIRNKSSYTKTTIFTVLKYHCASTLVRSIVMLRDEWLEPSLLRFLFFDVTPWSLSDDDCLGEWEPGAEVRPLMEPVLRFKVSPWNMPGLSEPGRDNEGNKTKIKSMNSAGRASSQP